VVFNTGLDRFLASEEYGFPPSSFNTYFHSRAPKRMQSPSKRDRRRWWKMRKHQEKFRTLIEK